MELPEYVDQRLADLELKMIRLEQAIQEQTLAKRSEGREDHSAADTLGEKLAKRIEEEGIDLESQPVGQLEFSVVIRTKGGTWSMDDSVALEKLMVADAESMAKSIGGLAHPVRIELFKALLRGPQESNVLLEIAGLNTTGQLYHHLQAMADVGLVERRSRNLWAPQNLGAFAMLLGAGRILSDWRGEN